MLVVHLLVDTRDAMGANAVNTMAELVSGKIEEITAGRVHYASFQPCNPSFSQSNCRVYSEELSDDGTRENGSKIIKGYWKHTILQWQTRTGLQLTTKA